MVKSILQKPDTFGVLASTLCVIHCVMTPLIFIAHTSCINGCEVAPSWWRYLDYVFLIISFLAVRQSAKNTSLNFMKPSLWISWVTLCALIINEKNQLVSLPEIITYIVALLLAALHIYNRKFCRCKIDNCCS